MGWMAQWLPMIVTIAAWVVFGGLLWLFRRTKFRRR